MTGHDFTSFCRGIDSAITTTLNNGTLRFANSKGGMFAIEEAEVRSALKRFYDKNEEFERFIRQRGGGPNIWKYEEKTFRAVFASLFPGDEFATLRSLGGSQTKALLTAMNKYVGFALKRKDCGFDDPLMLDKQSLGKWVALQSDKSNSATESTSRVGQASTLADAFEIICAVCATYDKKQEAFNRGSPEAKTIESALETFDRWASKRFGVVGGIPLRVKLGIGAGRLTRVPYMCLLPPGQEVSDGVYVAMCFGRDGSGAVIGCAESVSSPREDFKRVSRSRAPFAVDVNGTTPQTQYNDAFANPMEMLRRGFDIEKLERHIRESITLCFEYLQIAAATPEYLAGLDELAAEMVDRFTAALKTAGLVYDDSLPRTLIVSLLAKPFVILTGNSGSGKTKIAHLLAQWLSDQTEQSYRVIPVGADWTDNRPIVGFVNYLKTAAMHDGESPTPYESTSFLDLILRASRSPSVPHFLILDEMNLSHVERYFADLLSAMESGEPIPLHSISTEVRTSDGRQIPQELTFPDNVFVIGTVNVDETTYMFSPKVLDRANVLEVNVEAVDVARFLGGETHLKPIVRAEAGSAEALLNLSRRARSNGLPGSLPTIPSMGALSEVSAVLADLFAIMKTRRQEFAFRTCSEILRYISIHQFCAGSRSSDWRNALDLQILQKVLPKLHGSRRNLEALLVALATYCDSENLTDSLKYLEPGATLTTFKIKSAAGSNENQFAFSASHRKLGEMIQVIRRDQFVSFIQ